MAETFDERGEPIGTMPVEEPIPQGQPFGAQQPFISPSLSGRTDVVPGPRGGMVVPTGGGYEAGPNPQDQRNIATYMEQMAKAGRMDKAQKDVEQAMRFLGMRGVERDVQAGTPYHQALSKHLPYISWNNPQQAAIYSRIIEQAQPPAPLSMQNIDGVQVLRTPRGDRIVPQSAIPRPSVTSAQSIPFTNPETGQPIEGHFAVPSPTGRGFTVHRQQEAEPKMTPGQQRLSLNDAIKDKHAEIAAVPWVSEKDTAGRAARQQQLGTLNTELRELQAQRPNLTKKSEPKGGASVPAKADRKIGQVYQTPKGPHRWTAAGWEPAS